MHKVHKGDNNIESASEVIGSEDVPLLIFAYISHHLYTSNPHILHWIPCIEI